MERPAGLAAAEDRSRKRHIDYNLPDDDHLNVDPSRKDAPGEDPDGEQSPANPPSEA